jgi:hypothetical protein
MLMVSLADRKPIDPPPIVQLKVPEIKDPIRYVDFDYKWRMVG